MQIKPGFMLKEVAGEYYAIPFDASYESQGAMVSLNQSGAFLWQLLEEECDVDGLCKAVVEHYNVAPIVADTAVKEFLGVLREKQLLVE